MQEFTRKSPLTILLQLTLCNDVQGIGIETALFVTALT
jgi:hypothetical protein